MFSMTGIICKAGFTEEIKLKVLPKLKISLDSIKFIGTSGCLVDSYTIPYIALLRHVDCDKFKIKVKLFGSIEGYFDETASVLDMLKPGGDYSLKISWRVTCHILGILMKERSFFICNGMQSLSIDPVPAGAAPYKSVGFSMISTIDILYYGLIGKNVKIACDVSSSYPEIIIEPGSLGPLTFQNPLPVNVDYSEAEPKRIGTKLSLTALTPGAGGIDWYQFSKYVLKHYQWAGEATKKNPKNKITLAPGYSKIHYMGLKTGSSPYRLNYPGAADEENINFKYELKGRYLADSDVPEKWRTLCNGNIFTVEEKPEIKTFYLEPVPPPAAVISAPNTWKVTIEIDNFSSVVTGQEIEMTIKRWIIDSDSNKFKQVGTPSNHFIPIGDEKTLLLPPCEPNDLAFVTLELKKGSSSQVRWPIRKVFRYEHKKFWEFTGRSGNTSHFDFNGESICSSNASENVILKHPALFAFVAKGVSQKSRPYYYYADGLYEHTAFFCNGPAGYSTTTYIPVFGENNKNLFFIQRALEFCGYSVGGVGKYKYLSNTALGRFCVANGLPVISADSLTSLPPGIAMKFTNENWVKEIKKLHTTYAARNAAIEAEVPWLAVTPQFKMKLLDKVIETGYTMA